MFKPEVPEAADRQSVVALEITQKMQPLNWPITLAGFEIVLKRKTTAMIAAVSSDGYEMHIATMKMQCRQLQAHVVSVYVPPNHPLQRSRRKRRASTARLGVWLQ